MRRKVLRLTAGNLVIGAVVGAFVGWAVGGASAAVFVAAIVVCVVLVAGAINYQLAARRDRRSAGLGRGSR